MSGWKRLPSHLLWLALAGPGLASGCARDRDREQATAVASAAPVGGAECAACGMIVRDQPPPHGQVVFHDGTRAFACSVGDLVQFLAAPSGHGSPERVFVQALSPDVDPAQLTTSTPARWVDASTAWYVLGVARPSVMGVPVLVYATRAEADRVALAHGARVATWTALRRELLDTGDAP